MSELFEFITDILSIVLLFAVSVAAFAGIVLLALALAKLAVGG